VDRVTNFVSDADMRKAIIRPVFPLGDGRVTV
jgi:hypothetical protein